MLKAYCSQCGHRNQAKSKSELLRLQREHIRKNHKEWFANRIKAGKRSSQENPSLQDLGNALLSGPREAIAIYRRFSERQYQHMKRVMDALEPALPPEVRASWKLLEAIHDEFKR